MYPVSDSYIAARRASVKEERITGGIKLKDGTIIAVDDSVIIQGSLSVSREVCSSGKWDIGTLNYSKMQLRIRDDGAYDHEFGGALIKLSYGIVTAVAEDGTKTWEEVPLPPYYVDGNQTTRKRDMVKLTAYDPIKLLDINYPDTIPTTSLYAALVYVCNRAGIGFALTEDEFNALPNADVIPDFTSESVKTCRDVAMWIAQTVNCCGFCDYRGLLKLKQYKYEGGNNYDRLFTASERSTIEYSDTRTYLAYIQSYSGKDVKLYSKVTSWTGTDAPHIKEGAADLPKNPILQSLTPEQQDAVNMNYLTSRGYPTRYIKATAFVDPALEPLDVAAFSGGNIDVGQIINSVTQIKWKYRGKGTIVCESVSEHSEAASATSTLSLDNALDTASDGDTDEIVRLAPKSQLEKRIDDLEAKAGEYSERLQTSGSSVSVTTLEYSDIWGSAVDGLFINKDGTVLGSIFALDSSLTITLGNYPYEMSELTSHLTLKNNGFEIGIPKLGTFSISQNGTSGVSVKFRTTGNNFLLTIPNRTKKTWTVQCDGLTIYQSYGTGYIQFESSDTVNKLEFIDEGLYFNGKKVLTE